MKTIWGCFVSFPSYNNEPVHNLFNFRQLKIFLAGSLMTILKAATQMERRADAAAYLTVLFCL